MINERLTSVATVAVTLNGPIMRVCLWQSLEKAPMSQQIEKSMWCLRGVQTDHRFSDVCGIRSGVLFRDGLARRLLANQRTL